MNIQHKTSIDLSVGSSLEIEEPEKFKIVVTKWKDCYCINVKREDDTVIFSHTINS